MNLHDARVRADQARLAVRYPREYRLFRKYRDRSMVPRRKFVDNLRVVARVSVAGSLVECGCWQAGMSGAIAEVLPGRTSILLDSFAGLPDAGEQETERDHRLIERDRLVAAEELAHDTMRRSGAKFRILRGWFDVTAPTIDDAIAVLRLDGDLYDSTMVCLRNLFPRVPAGGIVIIDDYGDWDGCTRAVHDYLSVEGRTEPIERTASGVAFLRVVQVVAAT